MLSCEACNRRKADRTPREAGMRLLQTPRKPRLRPTLTVAREHFRPSWETFVSKSGWSVELR